MTLQSWPLWMTIAGGCITLAGLALLIWSLRGDRSRGRRRCPKCWYHMQGVPRLRCPECGREMKRERDLLRPRRRWRWAMLGFLMFAWPCGWIGFTEGRERGWIYLFLPHWKVNQEVMIGPYRVQVLETRWERSPDWTRMLRIQRDGQTLLAISGLYWSIGEQVAAASANAGGTIGVGDDVTGDGVPDLILCRDSGGTGCQQQHYLYSLDARERGSGLEPTAVLDACGRFEDIDGDGVVEFIAGDRTFAYRWTSGVASPNPEVVLRLMGGRFVVAPDLMRKPATSDAELNRRLVPNASAGSDWHARFPNLLAVVLDLIYTGNEHQAWEVLHERWPEGMGGPDRAAFEAELRRALHESPYWAEVSAMNVSADAPAAGVAMP